jgi:hypothetical protein
MKQKNDLKFLSFKEHLFMRIIYCFRAKSNTGAIFHNKYKNAYLFTPLRT